MFRGRRPSPALTVAFIALMIALGGTALAATGTLTNIADPSNASHVAKVDAAGKLNVGDGSGSLTVDGSVSARETSPANWIRFSATLGGTGCLTVYAPPAGKAAVIKTLVTNIYQNPSPGIGENVLYYVSTGACDGGLVLDINPATIGATNMPLDPGIAIPAGSQLSRYVSGSLSAEVYGIGYTLPSSSVPASAAKQTDTLAAGQQPNSK